jgi:hypothetical protein
MELAQKQGFTNTPTEINYNQLDFLLNEKDYSMFQSGIDHLRTHLLRADSISMTS